MGHFIVEGISTRVRSPIKIHGRFCLSKKTPDYKMTHQLFTLFWIISNILTFHFYTFSVIYTFYFFIAFEELWIYQKCSIKCVLYSLCYNFDLHTAPATRGIWTWVRFVNWPPLPWQCGTRAYWRRMETKRPPTSMEYLGQWDWTSHTLWRRRSL